MKITFLLPTVRISGGVRSTFEIANRLLDRGHDVKIVYPTMLFGRKWYTPRQQVVRFLKTLARITSKNNVDWFDIRADLIRVPTLEEKYIPKGDIVVATWWENVHDLNGYGKEKGEKFHFVRCYEIWGGPEKEVNEAYAFPIRKIVTSNCLKNIIKNKFGFPADGPLMNGINREIFYSEKEHSKHHSPKRIGILYRTHPRKGMEDAFKAFMLVRNRYPDIKLVLFGDKPTLKDMKMINKLGEREIHINLDNVRMRKIYNSLDIFLFPSRVEGFGNPPMEAMACGTACITTSTGAVPDYTVPGETALVCLPNKPNELADHMLELLTNEVKRQKIATQGSEYIKKFTWDNTVNELENIFREFAK